MSRELFVDGAGKQVEVHERTQECLDHGCCIHNPSVHALSDAPLVWRQAGLFDIKPSHMERICQHGVGHPDTDGLAYLRRIGQHDLAAGLAVHGCDGCCSDDYKKADGTGILLALLMTGVVLLIGVILAFLFWKVRG